MACKVRAVLDKIIIPDDRNFFTHELSLELKVQQWVF